MVSTNSYIGKEIAGYRIIAEIKGGSFGNVYQAQHAIFTDEPLVAIKLLHAHLTSPAEQEQFIQEARLLRKLKHPHILPILNAGLHENVPYIVMEYAAKGSLRNYLDARKGQPVALEEGMTILSQIGEAVQHAHEQNVVHRDLKPDNILFNDRGEVLLADFGIATIMATLKTQKIGVGGSPAYMAPEQFEGFVGAKIDQYALGCIAYELFTGRRPFIIPTPSLEAMWFQHAKVDPIPPTQVNPHLPKHTEQAILKALAKDRTNRHQDIATFISALRVSKEELFSKVNDHYFAGRFFKSWLVYEQAIKLYPNDDDVRLKMIEFLYRRLENITDLSLKSMVGGELVVYERLIQLAHTSVQPYLVLKEYERIIKEYERTIKGYEEISKLNTHVGATIYCQKGGDLFKLERYEEAIQAYEQAIKFEPDAFVYNAKGNALYKLERYTEALQAYERAIQLHPTYKDYYNAKGNALYKLERYAEALQANEEALQAYEQTINLEPIVSAYNSDRKGDAFYSMGCYAEALQAYEQAIELDPTYKGYYRDKGNALCKLGRYEEALQVYERAIELDPTNRDFYRGQKNDYRDKGNALCKLGRYEEASQAYERALQAIKGVRKIPLDSISSYVFDYIYEASSLQQLGRYKEAERWLEKAKQLHNITKLSEYDH